MFDVFLISEVSAICNELGRLLFLSTWFSYVCTSLPCGRWNKKHVLSHFFRVTGSIP